MRHCNYALRGVHYGILLIFYLYLRRLQFQEHHDISVTGYGDILLEHFEESPSLPAGLPRHLSQLVMATFSLASTYGVGYGDSGPVRLEDYIFGMCASRSTFSSPSLFVSFRLHTCSEYVSHWLW